MEVTIDRNELRESMDVLEQLERWERIAKATEAHSRGRVTFTVGGNCSRETIEVCVDPKVISSIAGHSAVERCRRGIAQVTARHVEQLVTEIKAIIREQIPLPIK